ncbi:MAG: tripartite tricarboxylate transporter TctB family protein [Pseudomonadota bacterium]
MSEFPSPVPAPAPAGPLRAPNDLIAALFLLACAGLAWWFGQDLRVGTAFRMGPGYIPRLLTWIILGFGLLLLVRAFVMHGPRLAAWPLRPILLVLGAMLVFAVSVERAGLLIASLLVVGLSALASPQNGWRSVLALATGLAVAACVLFPWLLQLPLRVWPR